jgi:hypothetical protein
MRITKRQLKRIIHESLNEAGPSPDMSDPDWHPNMSQEWESRSQSEERHQDDKIDAEMKKDIELDMDDLLQILDTAAVKANEIRTKLDNSNYAEWAGGREADDLQLKLIKIWRAMGFEGEDL